MLGAHYGFRPDFCQPPTLSPKGVVEALVGDTKADLIVPGSTANGSSVRLEKARAVVAGKVTVQVGVGAGVQGLPSNSQRRTSTGLTPCLRAMAR
jgi:hypothetical protein